MVKPGTLSSEELEFYKDFSFSHFIFFKKHFQIDFKDYLNRLKKAVPSLGFLAVDQEGGRVCRIAGDFVSPREASLLWEKEGKQAFLKWASAIAESLLKKGLNLNLAPCVDLGDENTPEFLKSRAFDSKPEIVAQRAKAFIEVHIKHRLLNCIKHFPGLREVEIDPHKFLPKKENVLEVDIYPFKQLLKERELSFVMTTHLIVTQWDNIPVTFSLRAVEVLRKEIGFKGLIFTDDLNMGALNKWELGERIILALASGHNILVYCGNIEDLIKIFDDLRKELYSSSVLRERIKEAIFILNKASRFLNIH